MAVRADSRRNFCLLDSRLVDIDTAVLDDVAKADFQVERLSDFARAILQKNDIGVDAITYLIEEVHVYEENFPGAVDLRFLKIVKVVQMVRGLVAEKPGVCSY